MVEGNMIRFKFLRFALAIKTVVHMKKGKTAD